MKRKIVVSALVLMMIGSSALTSNAYYKIPDASPAYVKNVIVDPIKIISPKQDIIVQDSLLISVQIEEDVSVTLSVYKENKDTSKGKFSKKQQILSPEKIEVGKALKCYNKQLKNLAPGKYRMVFNIQDKNGKELKPITKCFTIKEKEEEISESLELISHTKVTNVLSDISERLEQ
ncbi:hypothetical protein IZY60_02120 [Lutibacter sp. B2]|nr:hypothetical protein [Lutibacter sp. B2]